MYILGIHTGHDAAACLFKNQKIVSYCKEERLTRKKSSGRQLELKAINEVFKIAQISKEQVSEVILTRNSLPIDCFKKITLSLVNRSIKLIKNKLRTLKKTEVLYNQMQELGIYEEADVIDYDKIKKIIGLTEQCTVSFVNHHYAHILGAFWATTWKAPSLFLSVDGGGDNAHYSAYLYNNQTLSVLQGHDFKATPSKKMVNPSASIGFVYSFVTKMCGFRPIRHEGKITGLAAHGKVIKGLEIANQFELTQNGAIHCKLDNNELVQFLEQELSGLSKEDMAASVQYALEEVILQWLRQLHKQTGARYYGLSGGVFANVRLNQHIAELEFVNELFVFPAMGDEGLAIGCCLDGIIRKHGVTNLKRQTLEHLYLARPYPASDVFALANKERFKIVCNDNIAQETAKRLAAGKIGAIYVKAMEMGPRALGARSILASPAQRDINDSLNRRLDRTEFMPFAPYVMEEDAEEVFEINDTNCYACQFMTITVNVKEKYKSVIPAVVHIDGTARPQIIRRSQNALYYDILNCFKKITGIPCLVNTSFNAHEEPIINTPAEALFALKNKRIDFLICESGIIE